MGAYQFPMSVQIGTSPADLARAVQQIVYWLGKGGGAGRTLYDVDIDPTNMRNGTLKVFPSPVVIALDVNGKPKATLYRGAAVDFYDQHDPPADGYWHLRAGAPQLVVMGMAPVSGQFFKLLQVETG